MPANRHTLQRLTATRVQWGRRRLDYFAGCDYLGLSQDPRILDAFCSAAKRHGTGVGASRRTTGNHPLYAALESALCDFFEAPAALLTSTGYTANEVVAQGLAGSFTHALIDAQAHPSLQDAAVFLGIPVRTFRHRDAQHLRTLERRLPAGARTIVLTDGMFARDGSVPPLAEYRSQLRPSTWLWIDDCHAAGILGTHGRGSLEHCGIGRRRCIQTLTLSKAFGSHGGAILCDAATRRSLIEHSRCHAGSTPPLLPAAAAALRSLDICRREPGRRQRLLERSVAVKQALIAAGLPMEETPGPILALMVNQASASRWQRRLLECGIYPPWIQYPGAPAGGYFRFAFCSEHSERATKNLLQALTTTPPRPHASKR